MPRKKNYSLLLPHLEKLVDDIKKDKITIIHYNYNHEKEVVTNPITRKSRYTGIEEIKINIDLYRS